MNPLETVRALILLSFLALPMLIIGFTGFLSLGLGNISMFVLFLGHAVLIPLAGLGLRGALSLLSSKVPGVASRGLFEVEASDVSMLVPSSYASSSLLSGSNVSPSWWVLHVVFFLTYLWWNAFDVFMLEADPKAADWAVKRRETRAKTILILLSIAIVGLPLIRYALTHSETFPGLGVGILTSFGLGWGWFQFAKACGVRYADVFGIVTQILPAKATEDAPMTCVYNPVPTLTPATARSV
jgi:hypothetical protein